MTEKVESGSGKHCDAPATGRKCNWRIQGIGFGSIPFHCTQPKGHEGQHAFDSPAPAPEAAPHTPDCPHLDPQAPCICAPPPTADAPPEWVMTAAWGAWRTSNSTLGNQAAILGATANAILAAYLASPEARRIAELEGALRRIGRLKCIGGEARDCPCGGCIARAALAAGERT